MALGNDPEAKAVGGGAGASKLLHPAVAFKVEEDGLLGLAAASTATTLALTAPPPWINSYAYFATLCGTFFAGMTLAIASVWAADGSRRRAAGKKLALVVPLLIMVIALGISMASYFLQ